MAFSRDAEGRKLTAGARVERFLIGLTRFAATAARPSAVGGRPTGNHPNRSYRYGLKGHGHSGSGAPGAASSKTRSKGCGKHCLCLLRKTGAIGSLLFGSGLRGLLIPGTLAVRVTIPRSRCRCAFFGFDGFCAVSLNLFTISQRRLLRGTDLSQRWNCGHQRDHKDFHHPRA